MIVKFFRRRRAQGLTGQGLSSRRFTAQGPTAQGMVEFALILPLLLVVMLAIIEFGRLLFVYSAVFTASREAARYGAATGLIGGNTTRYQDCAGMRAAARRIGNLVGITDSNITITYDDGNGNSLGSCPVGGLGPSTISLGDRVIVNVTATSAPLVPLVNLPSSFPISSRSARTLLSHIDVQGTPAAPPPQVCTKFAAAVGIITEPTSGTSVATVQVTLSNPTNHDVYVTYSTAGSTATQGVDYSISTNPASPAGQFWFWSGRTSLDVNITVNADSLFESDETVKLTLMNAGPYAVLCPSGLTYILTIRNIDPPPYVSFTSSSQSVTEGQGASITAQLSAVSGVDATIPFGLDTISNTATLGTDFNFNTSSPLVIPAGQLTAQINLSTTDDALYEGNETIRVKLGTPLNNSAQLGSPIVHTVTILDNDPTPFVTFAFDYQQFPRDVGTAPVAVLLTDASGNQIPSGLPVKLTYRLTGTAVPGTDYTDETVPAGEVVINPGETSANIELGIIDNGPLPLPVSIVSTMGQPTNALPGRYTQNSTWITNYSPPPTVYFTPAAQTVLESAGAVTVQAHLSWAYYQDVTVNFSLGGTATEGSDYTVSPANHTVVIPAGSPSADITINIVNDTVPEPNETVVVNSSNATQAATVTIQDNDTPMVYLNSSGGSSVHKDGSDITVQALLNFPSPVDVTVPYSLGGSAIPGTDYTINPASPLVIPAGQTSATVTIHVLDNNNPQSTVSLALGNPTNAILSTPSQFSLTLLAWVCPTGLSSPSFAQDDLVWSIQGSGAETDNLQSVSINWPAQISSPLTGISFGGSSIWSGSDTSGSVTQSSNWSGSFTTNQFVFNFGGPPASGTYNVTASFAHCPPLNGSVTVSVPYP